MGAFISPKWIIATVQLANKSNDIPCRLTGFKLIRDGFVVIMHDGACKQVSNPDAVRTMDCTYYSHKPENLVAKTPDRSVLFAIMTWSFLISSPEYCNSLLKRLILYSNREPFCVLLPLLRHVVSFNDRNCRLFRRQRTLRWWRTTSHHLIRRTQMR